MQKYWWKLLGHHCWAGFGRRGEGGGVPSRNTDNFFGIGESPQMLHLHLVFLMFLLIFAKSKFGIMLWEAHKLHFTKKFNDGANRVWHHRHWSEYSALGGPESKGAPAMVSRSYLMVGGVVHCCQFQVEMLFPHNVTTVLNFSITDFAKYVYSGARSPYQLFVASGTWYMLLGNPQVQTKQQSHNMLYQCNTKCWSDLQNCT